MSRTGFPTSRSNPGVVQVRDDSYTDSADAKNANPGDVKALALLSRIRPFGQAKVFVRQRMASFHMEWVAYQAELRGCFILFYHSGKIFDPETYEYLTQLDSVLSVRECEVHGLVIQGRGEVLQLKNGSQSVFISFENPETLEKWKSPISRIARQPRVTVDDFEVLAPIGIGAGGKVFLVRRKGFTEKLAMKVIDKRKAVYIDHYHFHHAMDERFLLEQANSNPFCVQMKYCFQSSSRFYYVMEFCEGGDIFGYMWKRKKAVGEQRSKLVAAQVLLALEHIHSVGYIYRDLKPENVLIDGRGFVRLTDFGLSKRLMPNVRLSRTNTICGTFSYLAPEMLQGRYNSSVDVWTFGILVYQLITGETPCNARSVEDARRYFRRGNPVEYFPELMSEECVSFLKSVITPAVEERAGAGNDGISELKSHSFFSDVDWDSLLAREDGIESTLDVSFINRTVSSDDEDEVQLLRNFDMEELKTVRFEGEFSNSFDSDWTIFPVLKWNENGGDLSPYFLLGFDYFSEEAD
mmetsp:Transcript_36767/g.147079  ORF Transcript_36767/g.147079 Transcript_36767/m.147079 type:complete len:522 (-) Transcript_36767:2177-3742(-)